MNNPFVSVIVPTYNRRESLQRLLQALSQQTYPASCFEVVVGIDGSNDGTAEMLASFGAPYQLYPAKRPHAGRASACNAAIARATGELLILFDDDMEPEPDCIAAHVAAHASGERQAVLGPIPIAAASSTPLIEFLNTKFSTFLHRLAQPGYNLTIRDFFSSNMSIARHVMVGVGSFDEQFRRYGNEDVELACRLAGAGVAVHFSPAPVARQHYSKSFPELARDHIDKGRTALLLVAKHPEVRTFTRLAKSDDCSPKWRLCRSFLLSLSARFQSAPERIMKLVVGLERSRVQSLPRIYFFALDYFFWLGVQRGLPSD